MTSQSLLHSYRMYHNSTTSVSSALNNSSTGGFLGHFEGTTGNISSNNGNAGTNAAPGLRHQLSTSGSGGGSASGGAGNNSSAVVKPGCEAISPAVAAAAAAVGNDDSESDLEQFTGNRSRQKKFLKNFKQLPQEEVVLQRKYLGICQIEFLCHCQDHRKFFAESFSWKSLWIYQSFRAKNNKEMPPK